MAQTAAPQGVRARFFHSQEHGHVVELSMVADMFHTNVLHRVTPEHIARFPSEWDAYQRGQPTVNYGGTALTDVPGVEQTMLTAYALQGIHNAEQLAGLSDGQLSAFGLGARAARDAARNLLELNAAKAKDAAAEADRQRLADLEAKSADADAAQAESDRKIAELKAMLAEAEAKAVPPAKKAKGGDVEQAA